MTKKEKLRVSSKGIGGINFQHSTAPKENWRTLQQVRSVPWYELKHLDSYDLPKIEQLPTNTSYERTLKARALQKYHKEVLEVDTTGMVNALSLKLLLKKKLNSIHEKSGKPYADLLLDSLLYMAIQQKDISAMKLIFAYVDGLPALTLTATNTNISVNISESIAKKYGASNQTITADFRNGKTDVRVDNEKTRLLEGASAKNALTIEEDRRFPVSDELHDGLMDGTVTSI